MRSFSERSHFSVILIVPFMSDGLKLCTGYIIIISSFVELSDMLKFYSTIHPDTPVIMVSVLSSVKMKSYHAWAVVKRYGWAGHTPDVYIDAELTTSYQI